MVLGAVLLCAGALAPSASSLPSSKGIHGGEELRRFEYSQMHLGVRVRIVLYAPAEQEAKAAARAAFARIAELEDVFSSYRSYSELSRLCKQAGGPPVAVSEELFTVLQAAQRLARRTKGAFDVTVGPYAALWRRAREAGRLPTAEQLRQAGARVGWRHVHLDPDEQTVRLAVEGMQLDLGGIAKGYILDQALGVLKAEGARRALVRAGGDIVVGAPPPERAGWRVTVVHAAPEQRQVRLKQAAIASSGDTQQFVDIDGTRYSHVVDPRTGLGLTSRIAVTVVAPEGLTADSYATAISVLGARQGRALAQSEPEVSAYIRSAAAFAEEQNTSGSP